MIRTLTVVLAAATLANAAEPAKSMEVREIKKLAVEAKSAPEHSRVAEQWEARAIAFEAQAAKYEQEADARARDKGYNPMRHKWPAMAQGPIDYLRSKAMQARRAADESRQMMAHHRDLAIGLNAGN